MEENHQYNCNCRDITIQLKRKTPSLYVIAGSVIIHSIDAFLSSNELEIDPPRLRCSRKFNQVRNYLMNYLNVEVANDLLAFFARQSQKTNSREEALRAHAALPLFLMKGMRYFSQNTFYEDISSCCWLSESFWPFYSFDSVLGDMVKYGTYIEKLELIDCEFNNLGLFRRALESMPNLKVLSLHVDGEDTTSSENCGHKHNSDRDLDFLYMMAIGSLCKKLEVFRYWNYGATFVSNAFLYSDFPRNAMLNDCCFTLKEIVIISCRVCTSLDDVYLPLLDNCPNLKSVGRNNDTKHLLYPLAEQQYKKQGIVRATKLTVFLEHDEIDGAYGTVRFALNMCPNLQSVSILNPSKDLFSSVHLLRNIISLEYYVADNKSLQMILEGCGNNLLQLKLASIFDFSDTLDISLVPKLCPKLKHLTVVGSFLYEKPVPFRNLQYCRVWINYPTSFCLKTLFENINSILEVLYLEFAEIIEFPLLFEACKNISFTHLKKLFVTNKTCKLVSQKLVECSPELEEFHEVDLA